MRPMYGFTMSGAGIDIAEFCGVSIDGGGDVNADGFRDVIVGAWGANVFGPAGGTSYVIYGRDDGFRALFDRSWLNGENGAVLYSLDAADDRSGYSVAGAGDMNGDGIGDLIIAGPTAGDPNPPDSGRSYVVFGTAAPSASLVMTQLDGLSGTRLQEPESFNLTGVAVSMDGDSNGDGIADLLVGSFGMLDGQQRSVGGAYLVHGRSNPGAVISLGTLAGADGTRFVGPFYSLSVADSAGTKLPICAISMISAVCLR